MLRRGRLAWALIGSALVMQLGWLTVAVVVRNLSEVPGLTDLIIDQWKLWTWTELFRPKTHDPSAAWLVVGLTLTCCGYLAAIAAVQRWSGDTAARAVLICTVSGAIVFAVTLILLPGLLSTDLLSYAMFGRLGAVYGLNPYLHAITDVKGDPLLGFLTDPWPYPSPYGPLWTTFSVGLAQATSTWPPLAPAFEYRLLGALAHAANTYLIWRLLPVVTPGINTSARNMVVLAYAWNPLALFELIGNGHNDGVMFTLVLGGLLLASRRGGWLWGAGLIWAAALIKWVPAVVAVCLTCVSLATLETWRARAARLAAVGAVAVVLTVVVFWPWLDASNPMAVVASAAAGGGRTVNALADLPTEWLAVRYFDPRGVDLSGTEASIRQWIIAGVRVAFLVYFAFELRNLWRKTGSTLRDVVETSTRTLLVLLLLALNQVLAWYFVWPLCLGLTLGWRSTLARLGVAYSVVYLPLFYLLHENLVSTLVARVLVVVYVLLPLLVVYARSGRTFAVFGTPRYPTETPA